MSSCSCAASQMINRRGSRPGNPVVAKACAKKDVILPEHMQKGQRLEPHSMIFVHERPFAMTNPPSESRGGQGSLSHEAVIGEVPTIDILRRQLGVRARKRPSRSRWRPLGRGAVPPSSSRSTTAHRPAGGRRRGRRGIWYYERHRPTNEGPLILQGNVDVRQVNLAFKVEGRIETLTVDEGDPVKPGQVLATLDKRYFDDELRLARARRDNLKAVLERLQHGSRPEEIAEAKARGRRTAGHPRQRAIGP